MIQTTMTHPCPRGQSAILAQVGALTTGKQKYHCRDCGAYGTLYPATSGYGPERKQEILRAYQERPSMHGIERIYGVARQTLARWRCAEAERVPE